MSGWLAVAGLGPGNAALLTPEVTDALARATDIVGYGPYVARVAARPGLVLHPSDNRVELDRARHALELAAAGRRVVVVSSGDPGVVAMASASVTTRSDSSAVVTARAKAISRPGSQQSRSRSSTRAN